ncbi:MAG: BMP family ABC transporter substrate-binding protein [Clostridiales bacterium]|nr:BMP family ABC transporter substrate-binding protein [Clostridiales bacterium]
MKRRLLSLLMLCTVLLFSGCGGVQEIDDYATNEGYSTAGQTTNSSDKDTQSTDGSSTQETDGGIAKEDIKIGVLHLTDPAEGNGYTYTHDLGIQGMQNNLGLSSDQIIRKINIADTDADATRSAIQECIDEGCNIIFTTSWGYMDVTEEMAAEYPDIYFCHGTGYKSNGSNFTNYFGRIYQARYLSGIVAGMNTTTNKIGYVAAQDSSNSEVTGGIDAFALGIASVNSDAVVYVKITNSWYDPEAEKAAAKELLSMGCDVMAQHCDTAYPQTLAQDAGVYGIGYNSDMQKETPDSCLTSVIWNWSAYYTSAVQSIIDGTWSGENYYGGMTEGLVNITSLADFCAEGTQEKVDEAKAQILSGSFNVFDGELETNTGEIIGTAGSTLDDATITRGINWYYKNVQVVE